MRDCGGGGLRRYPHQELWGDRCRRWLVGKERKDRFIQLGHSFGGLDWWIGPTLCEEGSTGWAWALFGAGSDHFFGGTAICTKPTPCGSRARCNRCQWQHTCRGCPVNSSWADRFLVSNFDRRVRCLWGSSGHGNAGESDIIWLCAFFSEDTLVRLVCQGTKQENRFGDPPGVDTSPSCLSAFHSLGPGARSDTVKWRFFRFLSGALDSFGERASKPPIQITNYRAFLDGKLGRTKSQTNAIRVLRIGGNKILADVGPWLKDTITARFKTLQLPLTIKRLRRRDISRAHGSKGP